MAKPLSIIGLFTGKLDLNLKTKVVKSYIWSIVLYGTESWTLGKGNKNDWGVLNCGAGIGWRDQLDRSCEK
jgi:hypothetical protein